MKIAVLSESPADEAAIRILVEGLLGSPIKSINDNLRSRPGGWPMVCRVLPGVLRALHYQTDAEALVVVVDSNHSPIHQPSHGQSGQSEPRCRICRLRNTVSGISLRPRSSLPPIKTAFGLAVPAIEAWYLCGKDPHVTEAAWVQGLQSGSYPYTKNGLKENVYGTDRPSLVLETRFAIEEAQRVSYDLSMLERLFQNGFGTLAREVRGWTENSS